MALPPQPTARPGGSNDKLSHRQENAEHKRMWCTRSWAPSSFLPQDLTFKFVPGVPPQDLSQCFTNDWDPLPKRRAPAGPEVRRGLSILLLWECYLMQQLLGAAGPCRLALPWKRWWPRTQMGELESPSPQVLENFLLLLISGKLLQKA